MRIKKRYGLILRNTFLYYEIISNLRLFKLNQPRFRGVCGRVADPVEPDAESTAKKNRVRI